MNEIQLASFLSTSMDGGERILYVYNVIDSNGNIISSNNRQSFYAVDPELKEHIKAIRDYIINKRSNS